MIKIVSGVYGHYKIWSEEVDGKTVTRHRVERKDAKSEPFSLDPAEEKRLVDAGIAVYVEDEDGSETTAPIGFDETPPTDGKPEYNVDMKAAELREIGKLCGLTFKVGTTKEEMVAALDEHFGAGEETEDEDGDEVPSFNVADAVV